MLDKQKKSELFDEETADQRVIRSLLREIRKLNGEEKSMAHVIQGNDGKFWVSHRFEEVTRADIQERIKECEAELAHLKELDAEAEKLEAANLAPPADQPADAPAPADSLAPAADPGTDPATPPADSNAPAADTPASDASASADPAAEDVPAGDAPDAPQTPAPALQ